MTGRLIVVDGIDGGGKTTQMAAIEDWLEGQGQTVVRFRDPGSTDVGDRLRTVLLDSDLTMHRRTEALLFMAARSELIARCIEPALERGEVVLCDRYLLSTVVHQSVGGGVSPSDLWRVGRWATGGLDPDLTLLLDLPAAVSMRRVGDETDRMESRGEDYLESVRQAYLRELPQAGGRGVVIDATAGIDDVTRQIQSVLN